MTTYLKNKLADHALGTTTYTKPTTVHLALFSDATGDAGTGTELSGFGYARQTVAFDAAVAGLADNTAEEVFTAAGGAWDGATHYAIYDAATTGNMLLHGALSATKTLADGETLTFAAGDLDVQFN